MLANEVLGPPPVSDPERTPLGTSFTADRVAPVERCALRPAPVGGRRASRANADAVERTAVANFVAGGEGVAMAEGAGHQEGVAPPP